MLLLLIGCVLAPIFYIYPRFHWFYGAFVPTMIVGVLVGGREERQIALSLVAAVLLTIAAWRLPMPFGKPLAPAAVDLAFLAYLVFMALRSTKYWVSWAAAFQLLAVITHGAAIFSDTTRWAYFTSLIIWSWMILAVFILGSWDAWAERWARSRRQAPFAAAGEDL